MLRNSIELKLKRGLNKLSKYVELGQWVRGLEMGYEDLKWFYVRNALKVLPGGFGSEVLGWVRGLLVSDRGP